MVEQVCNCGVGPDPDRRPHEDAAPGTEYYVRSDSRPGTDFDHRLDANRVVWTEKLRGAGRHDVVAQGQLASGHDRDVERFSIAVERASSANPGARSSKERLAIGAAHHVAKQHERGATHIPHYS